MGSLGYFLALGVIGATVAISLAVLARLELYYLMGLVPLFPAFALMAHTLLASGGNIVGLRMAAAFGLYSLLPYAIYLSTLLLLSHVTSPGLSVLLGLVGWLLAASLLVFAWNAGMLPGRG